MRANDQERRDKLNVLAVNCVTGQDKDGLYIVDDVAFAELIDHVNPYIAKSVFNSTKQNDEDLINFLRFHVFKLLQKFGPTPMDKPFYSAFKLRVSNILTNHFRKRRNRSNITQIFLSEDTEVVGGALLKAKDEFENYVADLSLRNLIEKVTERLPEREKLFVRCFIENDGNFNTVAEKTGHSSCYIRKVLRRIKDDEDAMEVFEEENYC